MWTDFNFYVFYQNIFLEICLFYWKIIIIVIIKIATEGIELIVIADWVTYDNDLNELPKLSMLLLSYARATGPKYLIHVIQEKSMIRKAKPCELSCPDARERAGPVGEEGSLFGHCSSCGQVGVQP